MIQGVYSPRSTEIARNAMLHSVYLPCSLVAVICAAAWLTASCAADRPRPTEEKVRVLLDTDANNELDDQHAIAYLLLNGDVFDVAGITVNRTRGGGDIDAQALEAERIVRLAGLQPEIPIYKGASGPFEEIRRHVNQPDFDGAEAVRFIIEQAYKDDARPLVLLPIGKLTNVALALEKDSSIASRVRVVWLGSNYPQPGEYNQVSDEGALNYLLDADVPFEIAVVRYGEPSGTDAVRVTPEEMKEEMRGKGPRVTEAVEGRHGGSFTTFGDYSINLFEHIDLHGTPPSRALYDMAAVAIVKDPSWARSVEIPAPRLVDGEWQERPENPRRITLWENFDRDAILQDFFETMNDYVLAHTR
jgi:inosine-uridine nucleoside N-ribohydrolase